MTDIMKRKNFHSNTIYKFKLKNARELKLRTRLNESSSSTGETSPKQQCSQKPFNGQRIRCFNRVNKLNTIDEVINLIKITDPLDLLHLCQELSIDTSYNPDFVQSIQNQSLTYSFQSTSPPPSSKSIDFEDELQRDSIKLQSREFWNSCWFSYINNVHPKYPIFSLKHLNPDTLPPYLKCIIYSLGYIFYTNTQSTPSKYVMDYMEKCTQQWLKKFLFVPSLSHIQFLLLSSIYYYYKKNLKKSDAIQNQVLQMSYTLGLPLSFKSNNSLKTYEAYLTWVVVCSFRWETKGFKYLADNFPESPIPQQVLDHNWQIYPSIFGDHATLLGQCIAQKVQFEVELNQILLTNLNQIQLGSAMREVSISQKSNMIQKLSDKYMNYFNLIIQYYPFEPSNLKNHNLRSSIQIRNYSIFVTKRRFQA
ncbi:hypothetical protein CONCODRAFT_79399 [Conidiobolus coronatus NRRL 28638]|uniref:Transcription factor domain-containing protein n=1 Tax=Conidiobolus coronatus (strain ATCC 28846 / CBS 209.66 / NRRL 28638) TaxID=796925 RepID=A0A137P2L0_CONC2|nr:hypothetical protein CONCODRAFT_79399 [Conidiobolus coronatus NRRL 28638]|eukprot:KXN69270.1 hypothetical protein CONCODRAFT_79399 [Conidiobolus coronatus NRRL 28638]